RSEKPIGKSTHAGEIGQVQLVNLGVNLRTSLSRTTGRHNDMRARLLERESRRQPNTGITPGHDGQLPGELDTGEHLVSRATKPEPGPNLVLVHASPPVSSAETPHNRSADEGSTA